MESNWSGKIQLPLLNSNGANQRPPCSLYLMRGEEDRIVAEYGEKAILAFS